VLTVKQSEPGDEVSFRNLKNSNKELSFENFQKLKIIAKNGKAYFNGSGLKTDKEDISIEKVKDGKVR
ncbi:MAG: hypothetical protein AABX34_01050, partial [Nanoarchaeota archaeon]